MMHKVADFLPNCILNGDSVFVQAMQELATSGVHVKESYFLLKHRRQVSMSDPVGLPHA